MIHRTLTVLVLLAMTVIVSTVPVQAGISLGTVQVDKVKEAYPGESVTLKALFFNIHGESSIEVGLDAEYPPGWGIDIPIDVSIPKTDIIELPEPETGFEFINTQEGYIKAKPVTIRVSVPESTQSGSYDIKVSARTLGGGDATLSVSQSRSFRFTVIIKEDVPDEPGNTPAEENQGEAGVSTSAQPRNEDDIFIIDQDREDDDIVDDSGNEEARNETSVSEGVNGFVDSVTGAITASPVSYPVFVLMFMIFLFCFLKIKKRI
jgi:hypothetical protein